MGFPSKIEPSVQYFV